MTPSTKSLCCGPSWPGGWGGAAVLVMLVMLIMGLARLENLAAAPMAGHVSASCSIGAGHHPVSEASATLPLAAAMNEAESTCDEIDPRDSSTASRTLDGTVRPSSTEALGAGDSRRLARQHVSRLAATNLSRLCRRLL